MNSKFNLVTHVNKSTANDYQTPPKAVDLLLGNYLSQTSYKTVWECASGEGNIVKVLNDNGYNVISTDVKNGHDFTMEIMNRMLIKDNEYDIIVTNPPFNLKNKFIEICHSLRKPFALLLPLTALESDRRHKVWREGLLLLIPNKRINFSRPHWTDSNNKNFGGAWFPSAWFVGGPDINDHTIRFCKF